MPDPQQIDLSGGFIPKSGGGAPGGGIDLSGGYVPKSQPKAFQPPPADDTGVMASLKRTGSGLLSMPGKVFDAFTNSPANASEEAMQNTSPIPGVNLPSALNLGLRRLVADPMAAEHQKAQDLRAQAATQPDDQANNAYNGTNHLANMHDMASAVPVLGPLAAGIVNRFTGGGGVQQDKAGAVTDLATAVAAPEAGKRVFGAATSATAGKIGQSVKAVARPFAGAADTTLESLPVVGSVYKGVKTLRKMGDVPGQLKDIWNPQVGTKGVDVPGGVPPSGPNMPEPASPYRMSGDQIPDAQTVTPRQLIPPARQLNAVNPDPFTPAPAEPTPAPYSASGSQLTNPVTVTPREFIPPSRQLNAANPGDIDPMIIELNDKLRNSLNAGKQARAFPDPEILPPESAPGPGVPQNGAAPAIAVNDLNNPPSAGANPNPPRTFTPPEAPAAAKPSIETPANPDAYYGSTPPKNLVPQHQRQMGRFAAPPEQTPQTAQQRIFGNEEPTLPTDDDDLMSKLQKSVDLAKASKGGNGTAPQGGHAGNGVTSVEELNRSGTNYTVSKGGQVSYHGKSFAPESTPNGASHVTVLSDGSFRINAGQTLTPGQELALKNALKKLNRRPET